MSKFFLLCACVLLLCAGALAQNKEAYIGYSFFSSGKNGWNGDLGYEYRGVTLEGDLGGYYSHNNSIHSFMGGVKVEAHRRRGFTPFGHFFLGGSHVSNLSGASDTAFSWAGGVGLDSKLRKGLGLRLGADLFYTHFYNDGNLHLRAGAGLLYRFK